MTTSDRPITLSDMSDFWSRSNSSQSSCVLSANHYYKLVKTDIAQALEQRPELLSSMAQDALEAAILGMRRAIPGRAVHIRPTTLWTRLFGGVRKQKRIHPLFENDAFKVFLATLFDSIHNLPALMAPKGMTTCSHPDPAEDIARTLACLRLLPVTTAAADCRFERLFMARDHASADQESKSDTDR